MMPHYRAEAKRQVIYHWDNNSRSTFWFSRVFRYVDPEDYGPGELVYKGETPHARKGDATREGLAWCMGQPDVKRD